jgi:hypothetical protein
VLRDFTRQLVLLLRTRAAEFLRFFTILQFTFAQRTACLPRPARDKSVFDSPGEHNIPLI